MIDTLDLAGRTVEPGQEPRNGATKCNKVQNSAGLRWVFGRRILGQSSNRGQDRRHAIVEWSNLLSPFFLPFLTILSSISHPGPMPTAGFSTMHQHVCTNPLMGLMLQRGFLYTVLSVCIVYIMCSGSSRYSGVFCAVCAVALVWVFGLLTTAGFYVIVYVYSVSSEQLCILSIPSLIH